MPKELPEVRADAIKLADLFRGRGCADARPIYCGHSRELQRPLNLFSTLRYILHTPGVDDQAARTIGRLSADQFDQVIGSATKTMMKRTLLVIAVAALYGLHQDFWFWRTAHPLVFGFIPIGLFYHACFSVAASLLMWLLVTFAWPSHLEQEIEGQPSQEDAAQ